MGVLGFAFGIFPRYNCILCEGYLFWEKYRPECYHVVEAALFYVHVPYSMILYHIHHINKIGVFFFLI